MIEALLLKLDVTKILAHASDLVKEDLHVGEVAELEVVVAVQDWGRFFQDLLAGAEQNVG